jgi:hypothetical protein
MKIFIKSLKNYLKENSEDPSQVELVKKDVMNLYKSLETCFITSPKEYSNGDKAWQSIKFLRKVMEFLSLSDNMYSDSLQINVMLDKVYYLFTLEDVELKDVLKQFIEFYKSNGLLLTERPFEDISKDHQLGMLISHLTKYPQYAYSVSNHINMKDYEGLPGFEKLQTLLK